MWNTSRFPAHTDYVADLHEGYIPDVFVRTTANLDPAWGLMLYKELANRLRLDFTLSVRNDAWFLDATVFPVFSAPEAPGVSILAVLQALFNGAKWGSRSAAIGGIFLTVDMLAIFDASARTCANSSGYTPWILERHR